MLYLTRREGEAVIINNEIEVRIVEIRGRVVKIGFTFPADSSVLREELFLQIRKENEEAAKTAEQFADLSARTPTLSASELARQLADQKPEPDAPGDESGEAGR